MPTASVIPIAEEMPTAGVPRAYRGFSLGMNLADLKAALTADSDFLFRGDRDVSFLPRSGENLIECAGRGFIVRSFFQLRDEQVFIITLTLNTNLVDHYSVYQSFVTKYGEPDTLSPAKSVWEDDAVIVSIEKPLTIKYIDKAVYTSILENGKLEKSNELFLREQFLNEF
jgi:hypothetical protein